MEDFKENSKSEFDNSETENSNKYSSETNLANLQIIRNHVDTFILSMLSKNDCYGYEIMRDIDNRTHGKYNLKQPTLYSCLKRLEKRGDISSYWGNISNGARRRYYSLTKQGRKFLDTELECWKFERTIGDKLLSDEIIDLENYDVPFSEKDLKPKTKREKSLGNSYNEEGSFDDRINIKNINIENNENIQNSEKDLEKNENISTFSDKNVEISTLEKFSSYRNSEEYYDIKDSLSKRNQNEEINNKYFEKKPVKNYVENYNENSLSKGPNEDSQSDSDIVAAKKVDDSNPDKSIGNIFTYQDSPEIYKSEEELIDENSALSADNDTITESVIENNDKIDLEYIDRYFYNDTNDIKKSLKSEEKLRRKNEALKNLYPDDYSALLDDSDYSFSKKSRAIAKQADNVSEPDSDINSDIKEDEIVASDLDNDDSNQSEESSAKANYFVEQGIIKNKEIQNIAQLGKFYKTDKNKEVLNKINTYDTESSDLGYTSMSELKMKLYNKGYKLRPYSKENSSEYYSMNFIYANALRRDTSLIMYGVIFFELLITYLSFFSLLSLKIWPFIVAAVVFALIPTYFIVTNFLNKTYRIRARFDLSSSLITSSMAFICVVAVVILLGFFAFHADYNDINSFIMPIFVPIIFALNIPLTVVVYWLLYKSKRYHLS